MANAPLPATLAKPNGDNPTRRELLSQIFAVLGLSIVFGATLVLLALVGQLLLTGLPRLDASFFVSYPSSDPAIAGILSAWVGSLLVISTTMVFAIPLGIAAGIYLEEYAPANWVSALIEINVNNLAGVPSIVYGLLALGLFKQTLNLGASVLTAGATLALLILPIVIVTTREALRAVPNELREAAYALGATQWQMIWDHVLPCAGGSILTGIIMGLSRAIGETAPLVTVGALTFIAFLPPAPLQAEFPFISFAWLRAPFTVMPIQVFNWVSRPEAAFQVNAAAGGVVLLGMTITLNGLAIYLRYRFRRGMRW